MAIPVSSYEIIFPDSRQIVIVNAQPGERVDSVLIVNPSPTHAATLLSYEDIQSMLYNDGGPAFTTCFMELKTIQGSEAIPKFLDGSYVLDDEKCATIADYIMRYDQSLRAGDCSEEKIEEHSVKIGGNSDEVCVICQQEIEKGDVCAALECEHLYHDECIEKWLQKKNDCPVCRTEVVPFVSKIRMFTVDSKFLTFRP